MSQARPDYMLLCLCGHTFIPQPWSLLQLSGPKIQLLHLYYDVVLARILASGIDKPGMWYTCAALQSVLSSQKFHELMS